MGLETPSLTSELVIDSAGWCQQALRIPSPNFDARPVGTIPDLLVIHNISLPPGEFGGEFVKQFFCNQLDCSVHPYFEQLRGVRVSSHFLISRDGTLLQFVSINDRAWHAGVSMFRDRSDCNDFSIGIELEGTDFDLFSPVQYDTLTNLTRALQSLCPLTDVVGHQHIAPSRKTDPGPYFDWPRYQQLLGERTNSVRSAVSLRFLDLM
ncbi:MAG: 1,6-anhydro-N-acetylmuramyl-L-alanine amidase AmpD [Herbaspirillum sp.]